MDYSFLWGVIALACGAVMLVYGASMFRVVLAFAGFYIGFGLVWNFLGSLDGEVSQTVKFIMAVVLGAALGGILYSFVRIAVYAAGGILGLVLALFLTSLMGIGPSWLMTILAVAGAGVGAVFGRHLGGWLTILSSAIAGAYFAVTGLALIFGQTASNGMMPVNARALVVFVLLAVISIMAQGRTRNLRRSGMLVR